MTKSYLLDPVQILHGPNQLVTKDAALISEGYIKAFGNQARRLGKDLNIPAKEASSLLLAPCLVDPHSILDKPFAEVGENLKSFRNAAAHAGYGQIALLPRSPSPRDKPEKLKGFNKTSDVVSIHLWGSFSKKGKGVQLAPHAELINNGAIGIAGDNSIIPIQLLKKGLIHNSHY